MLVSIIQCHRLFGVSVWRSSLFCPIAFPRSSRSNPKSYAGCVINPCPPLSAVSYSPQVNRCRRPWLLSLLLVPTRRRRHGQPACNHIEQETSERRCHFNYHHNSVAPSYRVRPPVLFGNSIGTAWHLHNRNMVNKLCAEVLVKLIRQSSLRADKPNDRSGLCLSLMLRQGPNYWVMLLLVIIITRATYE